MKQPKLFSVQFNTEQNNRLTKSAEIYVLPIEHFANEEGLLEKESSHFESFQNIFFISGVTTTKQSEMASLVQSVKFAVPEATIIYIVTKQVASETLLFLKKSGANYILLEEEFLSSCKPEFIISRYLRGEWIPLKVEELVAETPLPFSLYYMMTLNRKIVPFIEKGEVISATKVEKGKKIGEFYFKREDLSLYQEYLKNFEDKSAKGLVRRCRGQYQTLAVSFKDLILNLTDQSFKSSFQDGKQLFDICLNYSKDFLLSLGAVGEAWAIVNQTKLEDFTPLDRAPAVAATAAIMSMLGQIGDVEQVFISSLFADLGLLDMPPEFLSSWRQNSLASMPSHLQEDYRRHPERSVNLLLNRKIPVPDRIRSIILASHEQADGNGFPQKTPPEKVPLESFLIQFSVLLDQELIVEIGRERKAPDQARLSVFDREFSGSKFPLSFLGQLKANL